MGSFIQVTVPTKNYNETKYVFHCLLTEFLGYEYEIVSKSDVDDFVLQVGSKKIVIANHYFSNDKLYTKETIPKSVQDSPIEIDILSYPLVSLFGDNQIEITDQLIHINSDIIASTFFMLTRWEEYVIEVRDAHDRFDVKSALANKFNFLNRPIVNEYVDVLQALLSNIGYKGNRKNRRYEVVPTHDVDTPYMWNSTKSVLRSLAHSTLKKPSWYEFSNKVKCLVKNKDPFDTHDYFMDLSDAAGVKSNFFFLCGGSTKYDNRYDINSPRIKKLLKHIQSRGHCIGIHPTYDSYNNLDMLSSEIRSLKLASSQEVNIGRHHYLRFSIPDTWRIWEANEMKWDSTLSYAGKSGFRCGVCYSYPVYDIVNRKQLRLREKPLIAMEVSIVQYENLSPSECKGRLEQLKNEVRKHNGEFVFLWHNSSFATDQWKDYDSVLKFMYT